MLRPSLNLSKERDTFANGAEGCVRETREGCPARGRSPFSELFEALKNASAWRKDFFAMLKGRPERMLRPSLNLSKERDTFVNGAEGCVRETREGCPARG